MAASPPIFCFAGRSGSGKTTLLVAVIAALRARGYRVATAKHDVHGATLDTEGKDSWRHKEAGAETVILVAPGRLVIVSDCGEDPSLEAIGARFAAGADVLLAEGFKRSPFPKVEVARSARSRTLLLGPADGLIAVATDFEVDAGVPRLDLNAPATVADFIEARFSKLRAARPASNK